MQNISITIEQAKTALECIDQDISISEYSEQEYECIETLRYYLNRAELRQRLKNAIKSIEGEN